MSEKIYRVQMNSKGMPNFSTAEEIIRCGECKRANYELSGVRCGLSDALMGEDGFCSIGERSRR